jgi:hypothetical protein
MRGIPEFNFPAFRAATKRLRDVGWIVYSPHEMDEVFASPDIAEGSESYEKGKEVDPNIRSYIRRDLHIIVNELQDGDAIVLLPGWSDSVGAHAECGVAKWCKLEVLMLEEAARDIQARP